jgi:hypothetical protein
MRILEPEPLGECPACGCVEALRMATIVGWRVVRGKVRSVELGARFRCLDMRCMAMYSVTAAGASVVPEPRVGGPPLVTERRDGSVDLAYRDPVEREDKRPVIRRRDEPLIPLERPRP